jgi:hypothetical protein
MDVGEVVIMAKIWEFKQYLAYEGHGTEKVAFG